MRRIGVLLCGCGAYDGSDVQETVLLLLALERRGLRPVFLAPDIEQADVVDHATGDATEGAPARRVIEEAARLARGPIQALAEVAPAELDALVVPGGMGVVKNLCLPGPGPLGGGPPRPEVGALLDALAKRGTPIGAIGLAEVVLARHQGRPLRPDPSAADPGGVEVDEGRNCVFTPGFLASGSRVEIARGIDALVDALADRTGAARTVRLERRAPGRREEAP